MKREIFSPKLFIDARVRQYIGAEIGNHIVTYVGTGGEKSELRCDALTSLSALQYSICDQHQVSIVMTQVDFNLPTVSRVWFVTSVAAIVG